MPAHPPDAPVTPAEAGELSIAHWVLLVGGMLVGFAPAILAQAIAIYGEAIVGRTWIGGLALLAAILLGTAGLVLHRAGRLGRVLAFFGAISATLLAGPVLRGSPGATLLLVLGLLASFLLLGRRNPPGLEALPAVGARAWRARGAATAATITSLLAASSQRPITLLQAAALALTSLAAIAFVVRWAASGGVKRAPRLLLGLGALITGLGVAASMTDPRGVVGWLALMPALSLFLLPIKSGPNEEGFALSELFVAHPPRLLVATFFSLCLAGTLALAQPIASASGSSVGYIDAMFTAVSAVCVTGLIVLDTPNAFSPFGHVVIGLLIQLGALGIMTFSTAALGLLGRRLGLAYERTVAGLVSLRDRSQIFVAVKRILLVTAIAELAGAVILTFAFRADGDPFPRALGRGVFTAISAFCNAGFALQTDSLVAYQQSPSILLTVSTLIVLGGVSPLVIVLLPLVLSGRTTRAQEKLILVATGALLGLGTLFFALLEWNGALANFSFWEKLLNAWFLSVTLRTAGFNSVDLSALAPATIALMLLWMFIGGSPGGTAGGVKTTTATVLLLAVLAAIRGRWVAQAFNRQIPHQTVYRAAAVATAGAALVIAGYIALQVTQDLPSGVALFEIVSALGTVGLSLGGTDMLDEVGKVIVSLSMFVGRVGPLTLFMFLSRSAAHEPWTRPEEEIDIG
jgi:trk system potassium uptake protein